MDFRLLIDGKELPYLDELKKTIDNIQQYFVNQTEYSGFPSLPHSPSWYDIMEIFDKADDTEKKYIFAYMSSEMIEMFRYWTVHLDMLYKDDKIEEHENNIEAYKMLGTWKENERNWNCFHRPSNNRGNEKKNT